MDECRKQFEGVISRPPYEQDVSRHPDSSDSAWPGNYKVYQVQLAWCMFEAAWNRRADAQWQPIETAPKDGTRVILGNKYGVWMGEFCDTYQSGYKPQNPWQSVLLNHDHISKQLSYFPTHWMPLPAAPEVKQ